MGDIYVRFAEAALPLVEQKLAEFEVFTYEEVGHLPEVDGQDTEIAGIASTITVFRQDNAYGLHGKILIVVLAARPTMFGMGEQHVERGLVFSPHEPTRPATKEELRNSGG
jgi:hypothetical protein